MAKALLKTNRVLALGRDIMVTMSRLQFLFLVHPWERSEHVMTMTGSVTQQVGDALGAGS